jgi:hypothetical protein
MKFFNPNLDIKKQLIYVLPNYREPSLMAALILEEKDKIKMNILNTIVILIDNLPIKVWLKNIANAEEEGKNILLSLKNIYYSLIYILYKESDLAIFNQILRVFQIMI